MVTNMHTLAEDLVWFPEPTLSGSQSLVTLSPGSMLSSVLCQHLYFYVYLCVCVSVCTHAYTHRQTDSRQVGRHTHTYTQRVYQVDKVLNPDLAVKTSQGYIEMHCLCCNTG